MSVSQRHWQRVKGKARTTEEIAEAADRLCFELHAGLSRWIGVEGYRTLQDRALREVVNDHPVLAKLTFGGDDLLHTVDAVREHGAEQVAAGMVAFVASVIELLGRIIGVDMALRLVEHWGDRARAES